MHVEDVILVCLLVVFLVILCALSLAVFGALVSLAAFGLSALIVLLMLCGIVVTNAIVLRDLAVATNAIVLLDLAQHKSEAGGDVRTVLTQGGRTHVHPILMRGRVGTWPSGSNRWPGRR